MTRDIAQKLKYQKPASIYSTFFPALQGMNSKMAASVASSAIFVTDKPDEIKKKINKYAFSGGQPTKEEQEKYGANLEVDVPYQWLTFFLEDDQELAEIAEKYSSGKLQTGEVKARLIKCLQEFVKDFQERRKKVTDEDVKKFMSVRKIDAMPTAWAGAAGSSAAATGGSSVSAVPGALTLYSDITDFSSASIKIVADLCGIHLYKKPLS